jgi:hypothetical protein
MTLIKKFSLAFLFLCFPMLSWAGEDVTTSFEIWTGDLSHYQYRLFKVKKGATNKTLSTACHMHVSEDSALSPSPPLHLSTLSKIEVLEAHASKTITDLALNTDDEICVFAWKESVPDKDGKRIVAYTQSPIVKVKDVLDGTRHKILVKSQPSNLFLGTVKYSNLFFGIPSALYTPPSPSYTIDILFHNARGIVIYQPFLSTKCYHKDDRLDDGETGGIILEMTATDDEIGKQQNMPLFPARDYTVEDASNYSFCYQIRKGLMGHQTYGPYYVNSATRGNVGTIEVTGTEDSCFRPTGSNVCESKKFDPHNS